MGKIVAMDMDGTILNRGENALAEQVLETVKKLDKKGIVVIISSGRTLGEMKQIISLETDNLWLCCLDGALIYKGRNTVCTLPIDEDTAENIIKSLKISRNSNVLIQKERKTQKITEITDFKDILRISVFGENAIFDGKKATHMYENKCVSVSISGEWYEINATGADKGAALSAIAKMLNIDKQDIIAFGDNYNDIPMFRASGTSYAVKNSWPKVIAAADYVTDDLIKTIGSELL